MSAPTAATLLRLWERGQGAAPPERALLLLAATEPEQPLDALAQWPLGARDGRIFRLRERLFGPTLTALAICPACAERVELALDAEALRSPEPDGREGEVSTEGIRIRFRLPNGGDLAACADCADVASAEERLLARCVIEATRNGAALLPSELPPSVRSQVSERMAEADPGADLELELTCPACSARWRTDLDIASYLWTELHDWSLRILRDVHQLASAYGWSETDILALSPLRRRLYLEMAAP